MCEYSHSVSTLDYNFCFTRRSYLYSDYIIISCSWQGATSARLWYASCSYPKMCHKSLYPLIQECSISCILLCCKFLLLWDSSTSHGRNCDCVNEPINRTPVRQAFAASVLPGSFWSHCYCQSVILFVFSNVDIILDDNLASSLLSLKGPQNAR
jgi:hypothetical protein